MTSEMFKNIFRNVFYHFIIAGFDATVDDNNTANSITHSVSV